MITNIDISFQWDADLDKTVSIMRASDRYNGLRFYGVTIGQWAIGMFKRDLSDEA